MFVYIYDNKGKDIEGKYLKVLEEYLNQYSIPYKILNDEELNGLGSADAIFVLGGDGTILWLVEYANRNNIPLIGINVGKLGFLSEFEACDIESSVKLFKENLLTLDKRMTLKVTVGNEVFYCLNDVYMQRIYTKESGCMTAEIMVNIDDKTAEQFKGDGVIICSPTGSTAYSLSAGGPILAPNVNAFSITPIAAHAYSQRAIVCNSDSVCEMALIGRASANLFVDGRYVAKINKGENIKVEKADNYTLFLRKQDFNFYYRLSNKLKFDCGEGR